MTTAIRVLHLASGDLWAGAEMQLFLLARAQFRQPGIDIRVVLFNYGILEARLRDVGIRTYVIDEQEHGALVLLLKLVRLIRELQPHILHTHRIKEDVLGSFASLLCRGTSILCTVHGAAEVDAGMVGMRTRMTWLADDICTLCFMKKVVCVSPQLLESCRFVPTRRLSVIDNGIDVSELEKSSLEGLHLQTGDDRKRVGFFGRLVPIKRVDLVVEIARRLQERHPGEYEFFLFGEGPEREKIVSMVQDYNLHDVVKIMGFVENAAPCLRQMDVMLLTSDMEGLPMIVLEAMTLKVSVVSHAIGSIAQVLDQGRVGTLVHKQDPEAYAEAIISCLKSERLRKEKCEAAYERIRQTYSIDSTCLKYMRVYESVVKDCRDGYAGLRSGI